MKHQATKAKFELLNDIHRLISFSTAKDLVEMTGTEDESIYSQQTCQTAVDVVPDRVKEFPQVRSQDLKIPAHLLRGLRLFQQIGRHFYQV